MTKHTSLPWKYVKHESVSGNDYIQLLSGSWDIAHTKFSARDFEEEIANAEFICRAANAFYDLLEACKKANAYLAKEARYGMLQSVDEWCEVQSALSNVLVKAGCKHKVEGGWE